MVRKSLYTIAVIAMLGSFAPTAAGSVVATFDRNFQVSGPVNLDLNMHSADIVVRNGPAGEVRVHGKIGVSRNWPFGGEKKTPEVEELQKNPPIQQNGNSIRIDYSNVRNVWIDYEITVPADTAVRSRASSGDLTLEGLHGKMDLQSTSGDFRLRDLSGEIHLEASSGDVSAESIAGPVEARTGSGDIRMEQSGPGDVNVQTGSGNIELRGLNGSLRAEAGSGDLRIEGTQAGAWEIRTGSGDVELRLPSQAAFDLELSTSSGTLTLDQPVLTTVQGRVQETRRSISGKVRGGGKLITVHTSSGDVHVY
jgi:hypothetical protein